MSDMPMETGIIVIMILIIILIMAGIAQQLLLYAEKEKIIVKGDVYVSVNPDNIEGTTTSLGGGYNYVIALNDIDFDVIPDDYSEKEEIFDMVAIAEVKINGNKELIYGHIAPGITGMACALDTREDTRVISYKGEPLLFDWYFTFNDNRLENKNLYVTFWKWIRPETMDELLSCDSYCVGDYMLNSDKELSDLIYACPEYYITSVSVPVDIV